MPQTPVDRIAAAQYIASLTNDLERIATECRLDMLAYLLALARQEASSIIAPADCGVRSSSR